MCVVSNITDYWQKDWINRGYIDPNYGKTIPFTGVSKEEFEALRKEMEELKALILVGMRFDAATGQPHCEMKEKVELVKAVAKALNVDLNGLFGEGE